MKRHWVLIFFWGLAMPAVAETLAAQKAVLAQVDFDQKLNAQVPLDLRFQDSGGRPVTLADYFHGQPVILSLVYYQCPMLCTESLNGLVRAIRSLSLDAGRQYGIVTVSFDPSETSALAAAKKKLYVERYGRASGARGWNFLVGNDPAIKRLTRAVGFHYVYDPLKQQYAHATGIVVLTPQGQVSHYLYGVEYSARDLRLALIEAATGRIGSPVDKLLLYCYRYDPATGKYNLRIFRILRLAGVITLLGLAVFIGRSRRR